MPKAIEIAQELRRIADALDREPETDLVRPMVSFYCNEKDEFLAAARLLPRPMKKEMTEHKYGLENGYHNNSPVWLRAYVDRNKVCVLLKPAIPAVYDCAPLLSEEEENLLVAEEL
jgi:hypothetical protein